MFLTSAHRALKNERDGNPLAYQLDAADAIGVCLYYVCALHARERPYNKYLRWELTHYPLPAPEWAPDQLLPCCRTWSPPQAHRTPPAPQRTRTPRTRSGARSHPRQLGEDLPFMQGKKQ